MIKGWGIGATKEEVLKQNPDEFYLYVEVTAPTGEIWNVGKFMGVPFDSIEMKEAADELVKFLIPGLNKYQRKRDE